MKTELWAIGKTNERYLEEGMELYRKRLGHYLKFGMEIIPDIKKAVIAARHNWSLVILFIVKFIYPEICSIANILRRS